MEVLQNPCGKKVVAAVRKKSPFHISFLYYGYYYLYYLFIYIFIVKQK